MALFLMVYVHVTHVVRLRCLHATYTLVEVFFLVGVTKSKGGDTLYESVPEKIQCVLCV